MYIDSSRIQDLLELKEDMADESIPLGERRKAYRAYCEIQAQLKDKKLAAMRERLAKAQDVSDRYEVWKIRNQIKDYLGEELINERTY